MSLFAPGDNVHFWSRQLSEHALFLALGLTDPSLSDRAMQLHKFWEAARKDPMFTRDLAKVQAATDALIQFKSQVLQAQKTQWVGWLFPLFVDHIRREAIYFQKSLQNQQRPEDELCEWLTFMKEHAQFAAQLLDPSEQAKIFQAHEAAGAIAHTIQSGGCGGAVTQALIDLSRAQGNALDRYVTVELPAARSVIHPVLLDHVKREGHRFLQTLQAMQAQMVVFPSSKPMAPTPGGVP